MESEDFSKRLITTCKLYGVVSGPQTLKPEVTLSFETSLNNSTARHHVPESGSSDYVYRQEILSTGQSLLSRKEIMVRGIYRIKLKPLNNKAKSYQCA
jgi:hypothetical protein